MIPLLQRFGRALRWTLAGLSLALVAWSFARVLSRPFRQAADGGGRIELTLMHWAGEGGQEEDAIVERLLAEFEARHPHVRLERINPGDTNSYYNKLQTMMASGEPPDVFYLGSERLPAYAHAGLVVPVDDFLAADHAARERGELPSDLALDLDDFYPVTLDAFRWNGTTAGSGALYGIPKDFTTIGFYGNRDLFRRAGATWPEGEWTWDEFAAACRKIGELPGCTGAEFVTWPPMLRLYLWTEGVDVATEDFRALRLREPAVHAALERLRGWRHDEASTLTSGRSKVATGASVFLTGKVGLAGPFGRWVVPSYRNIEDFAWDFLPMPRGAARANAVATVAWSISSRTEHPKEAWALVRHLTGEESQRLAAPLGLAVPALRSVAESEAFLEPEKPPANDRVYLDEAEHARVMIWPTTPKFEQRMENRLNQALKTGDLPLDEAIALFEEEWRLELESPTRTGDFPRVPWGLVAGWGGAALLALLAAAAARWWRMRPGRLEGREELAGLALVAPWVIGFAIFLAFPIVLSLLLSFSRWTGMATLDHAEWVGFGNYRELLAFDQRFRTCLRVTGYYALLAVPLGQAFALGAALLLSRKVRFAGFFRSAWYLPSVLAGVGVAVLWRWVFDGDNGLLNLALTPLLEPFGAAPPEWFDRDAAIWGPPAFALLSLWMVGGSMVIDLAGLKGIPEELHEAASIDGCGWWRRFRHVTLPLLSPVIFFNLIIAIIGSFQIFTQAYVMTGGEPGDLTRFYVLYLYNQAFEQYEMGYASALAWILLVIILLLTLFVMRGSRRFVYYEALQS